jgi:hypothetical protein
MVSLPRITFQLRRLGRLDVMPGLTLDDLKALSDWAHLHPMDEISMDGRAWIKIHEFKELGMVWLILDGESVVYGPTSVGTLKEFLVQGEIGPDQRLRNHGTGEIKTLREIIGEDYIRRVFEAGGSSVNQSSAPVPPPENRADRISQLEARLQATREDLVVLTGQYRQALKTLMGLRSPTDFARFTGFSG